MTVIAIIGGTGDLGSGLARIWAKNGHAVILGSRHPAKAEAAAAELAAAIGAPVRGAGNRAAASEAEIVVIAVPFGSHKATLEELRTDLEGKIVIDAVVPLVPPKVSTVRLPPERSAAEQAQQVLGPGVRVVSAFHNVGATKLRQGQRAECDILVFSDDKEARDIVAALAREIGTSGIPAGPLANSAAAEALTSVLIWINRNQKVQGAGIRITGLPGSEAA